MSTVAAPEFSVEAFLLESPHGYELLDMLVQANVNPRDLTPDDLEKLVIDQ